MLIPLLMNLGMLGSGPLPSGGGGRHYGARPARPVHFSHAPSYYYRKIIESDAPKAIKREAAAIVRPYTKKKSAAIPKVREVDWRELALVTEILNALIRIWIEEVKAAEIESDDEEWMMAL